MFTFPPSCGHKTPPQPPVSLNQQQQLEEPFTSTHRVEWLSHRELAFSSFHPLLSFPLACVGSVGIEAFRDCSALQIGMLWGCQLLDSIVVLPCRLAWTDPWAVGEGGEGGVLQKLTLVQLVCG